MPPGAPGLEAQVQRGGADAGEPHRVEAVGVRRQEERVPRAVAERGGRGGRWRRRGLLGGRAEDGAEDEDGGDGPMQGKGGGGGFLSVQVSAAGVRGQTAEAVAEGEGVGGGELEGEREDAFFGYFLLD